MYSLNLILISVVGITLASSVPLENGNRLIKTSENEPGKWLNQEEIFALIRAGQHFVDITDLGIYNGKETTNAVQAGNYCIQHTDLIIQFQLTFVKYDHV